MAALHAPVASESQIYTCFTRKHAKPTGGTTKWVTQLSHADVRLDLTMKSSRHMRRVPTHKARSVLMHVKQALRLRELRCARCQRYYR